MTNTETQKIGEAINRMATKAAFLVKVKRANLSSRQTAIINEMYEQGNDFVGRVLDSKSYDVLLRKGIIVRNENKTNNMDTNYLLNM